MKTTKQFSIMMAVVLLSFSINSCKAQKVDNLDPTSAIQKSKNITITLHVNTDLITQENKEKFTYLTYSVIPADSLYIVDPPPVDETNKNFTTPVRLKDTITWVGVSFSSPDTDIVKIKKIKHEDLIKILNKEELEGETIVVGEVKYGNEGEEEKYSIMFTVYNNGEKRNGNFKIDPKLQIGG